MPRRQSFTVAVLSSLALAGLPALAQSSATAVPLISGGSTALTTPPIGPDGVDAIELDPAFDTGDADGASDPGGAVKVNRSLGTGEGPALNAPGKGRAKSNPEILRSLDGVNFHDQRFSNGGNQFSVEPPDQALCVGGGYVLESVNDVLRVFDTAGNPVAGPTDLNTFYGYPAAINRSNGKDGPSITDPICYFDPDTQRFFHVTLTLDRVGSSANLSGKNHLDIAVSQTSNPAGAWTVYKLPVQNDGTDGTPNHHCKNGPCLGDYPHIGADANAIFLTTNEFAVFGSGFYGSQVYAISKRALVAGTAATAVQFNTSDSQYLFEGAPGFTVWPAIASNANYNTSAGGTESLLSTMAVFSATGIDTRISLWSLTNTSSIDSASPALTLSRTPVTVGAYAVPGKAAQKAGSIPLAQCIGDNSCSPLIGAGRNNPTPPEAKLDAGDSRMQQVYYANGKLWAAFATGVIIDGSPVAQVGFRYVIVNPDSGKLVKSDLVGLLGNNLTYPAAAVTDSGRGIIAFTVVGSDFFPSTGYVSLDAKIGAGAEIHVTGVGAGPQDGFAGYKPFSTRPRWGDYGAAATDGDTIWMASEYINQTCSYQTYKNDFTCGGTRGSLGNWATRITQVGF
jgi:hypothetical protein